MLVSMCTTSWWCHQAFLTTLYLLKESELLTCGTCHGSALSIGNCTFLCVFILMLSSWIPLLCSRSQWIYGVCDVALNTICRAQVYAWKDLVSNIAQRYIGMCVINMHYSYTIASWSWELSLSHFFIDSLFSSSAFSRVSFLLYVSYRQVWSGLRCQLEFWELEWTWQSWLWLTQLHNARYCFAYGRWCCVSFVFPLGMLNMSLLCGCRTLYCTGN